MDVARHQSFEFFTTALCVSIDDVSLLSRILGSLFFYNGIAAIFTWEQSDELAGY
jgi:hypothetical protein